MSQESITGSRLSGLLAVVQAESSSSKKLWKGLEKMIEFFMFCFVLLFYLVLVTTFLLNSSERFFSS